MFPHIHWDRRWEERGLFVYYQCRCGARRIRRAFLNWDGPAEPGWPPLRDKHGREVFDSGWHR